MANIKTGELGEFDTLKKIYTDESVLRQISEEQFHQFKPLPLSERVEELKKLEDRLKQEKKND